MHFGVIDRNLTDSNRQGHNFLESLLLISWAPFVGEGYSPDIEGPRCCSGITYGLREDIGIFVTIGECLRL